jgi:hypothetical protein
VAPKISFVDTAFIHCRSLTKASLSGEMAVAATEGKFRLLLIRNGLILVNLMIKAMSWIAETAPKDKLKLQAESLVDGIKRGTSRRTSSLHAR